MSTLQTTAKLMLYSILSAVLVSCGDGTSDEDEKVEAAQLASVTLSDGKFVFSGYSCSQGNLGKTNSERRRRPSLTYANNTEIRTIPKPETQCVRTETYPIIELTRDTIKTQGKIVACEKCKKFECRASEDSHTVKTRNYLFDGKVLTFVGRMKSICENPDAKMLINFKKQ